MIKISPLASHLFLGREGAGFVFLYSCGIGGKNCIDYLIKVRRFSFVDAVLHLTGALTCF